MIVFKSGSIFHSTNCYASPALAASGHTRRLFFNCHIMDKTNEYISSLYYALL